MMLDDLRARLRPYAAYLKTPLFVVLVLVAGFGAGWLASTGEYRLLVGLGMGAIVGFIVFSQARRVPRLRDHERRARIDLPLLPFILLMTGGLIVITGYAWQYERKTGVQFLSVAASGAMIAGAFLLAGGLLGFLFGMPLMSDATQNSNAAGAATAKPKLNPNLLQISDWLTKILVGVGLTQLAQLPVRLERLADFLSPALGGEAASSRFALALVIYSASTGFLTGFLWSALRLPGQLNLVYTSTEIEAMIVSRDERDAAALREFGRILDRTYVSEDMPSQPELNEVMRRASPTTRQTLFDEARDIRGANWRASGDHEALLATQPVFEALVARDEAREFHRNRAELAYVLKDRSSPDLQRALDLLNDAISVRDRHGRQGWKIYEYNRAVCRINLDEETVQGRPSPQALVNDVIADLERALSVDAIRSFVARAGDTEPNHSRLTSPRAWLRLNRANSRVGQLVTIYDMSLDG